MPPILRPRSTSNPTIYHLDELVDVGLVDKRQRRTADSQGFYTYYRPTAMGRGILEHGVEELMRREREFNDAYS